MNSWIKILVLLLLGGGAAMGQNDRSFHARARVINLEPVTRPDYATAVKAGCQRSALPIAGSMALDIRQQERNLARQRACEVSTKPRHKVVGYWLTYDYQGHQGRKYVSDKPGDWIPVTISLEPLHASRVQH